MNLGKKVLLTTAAVVGGAVMVSQTAAAQEPSEQLAQIVERIAAKLNMQPSQVQSVLDEMHSEKQTEMQTRLEERLTQAVTDGKITEVQKQAILSKHAEMQTKMEALRGLTPEERKTEMEKIHEEMKIWAEENDIDFPFIGFGRGFHMGMKMGHWPGKDIIN
ncbi:TPA: hypothetical protein DIV55_04035 [Patescibacteria group bacterium]|uniref:Uncharacterized protein n=1 Tax=Candidatus Gottesmanbacteria bacterium GW2011_GWA1_43_11 TaxID=1618436 RepID=A0A0G1ENJ9_9BACT|nr:MAG: hypothetical protein UV59_C0017G0039 [Candidatus Gottesmanbacteria bacterium GW2011_GWA1_43_11]HCS78887.1 hypothetical protein [Patescibacteria group bacterium]